jgi:hypothetical protein
MVGWDLSAHPQVQLHHRGLHTSSAESTWCGKAAGEGQGEGLAPVLYSAIRLFKLTRSQYHRMNWYRLVIPQ